MNASSASSIPGDDRRGSRLGRALSGAETPIVSAGRDGVEATSCRPLCVLLLSPSCVCWQLFSCTCFARKSMVSVADRANPTLSQRTGTAYVSVPFVCTWLAISLHLDCISRGGDPCNANKATDTRCALTEPGERGSAGIDLRGRLPDNRHLNG